MSCSAVNCTNRPDRSKGSFQFFRFPAGDRDAGRLKQWLVAMRRKDWKPTPASRLCSAHFEQHFFTEDAKGNIRLKSSAVPSKFCFPRQQVRSSITGVRRKILVSSDTEVSGSSLMSCEVSGNNQQDSAVDQCRLSVTSAADCSSVTLTENDNGNIPTNNDICQADTAVKVDVKHVHHSYAASSDAHAKLRCIQEDHCYHLESPRSLKRKNEATEEILDKFRKKLKLQCQKCRRLKKKVCTLKDVTNELKQKLLISSQCASLLESIDEVPKWILRQIQQGKKSAKYSEELKQFATTQHFYSPKAYEYVRDNFHKALPHSHTIRSWYSSISADPGFTVASFTALKYHVEANSEKGKETVCALMMDEICIHKMTEFAGDRFHGYVDIGTGEIDNTLATQALVIMVVAVNESWKIPIAYFLITGIDGSEKANVVRESLSRLHEVGVRVVSLTCDAPTNNLAMIRQLGADLNINNMKPYFMHPEDPTHKVHVILDACHMLKLLRNAFASSLEFETEDGRNIEWKYLEALNKLQEEEGLRLGNKLRMAHLQWRKQKMKVHLAAQLFSSSVADAMEYCEQGLKLEDFKGCAATVQFLRIVDAAFDVLNSRNPLGKGFKAPIKPATKDRAVAILDRAETMLRGLKVRHSDKMVPLHTTRKKTAIYGFIANGRSVLNIYHDLVEWHNAPCRYLLTYKLSQDHLELFFAAIRARGGRNDNPNARQFRGAYKRLLVRHQVTTGTGNCLLRVNTHILSSTPATVNVARRMEVQSVEMDVSDDDFIPDLPHVCSLSEYQEAAINYITGFVVKKMKDKITCLPCSQALTTDGTAHSFIHQKNRGGLQKPSPGMVAVCLTTEKCIQRRIKSNGGQLPCGRGITSTIVTQVLADSAEKNLFPDLHSHMFDTCVEVNHIHVLVKMASSWYCKVRFNHFARTETQKEKNGKMVRRQLTKLIHFYGE